MSQIGITALGQSRYRIVDGDSHRVAHAVSGDGRTWVFLEGRVYVITQAASGPARRRSRGTDESALAAPMPATVVSVNVTAGQQVAAGDVMIQLEAMKMELPIKAPRNGVVKTVACRAGELVQPGVPLVELE